jgi:hypothetical protein
MPWVEIFAVLLVAHLVGDFLLQTEWQATNKFGGLGRDPVKRRALVMHVLTYSVPFVPAIVWLADHESAGATVACAAVVVGTHFVQDDGRLLATYMRDVKKTNAEFGSPLWMSVDQSCHIAFLFCAALLATTG